MLQSPQEIVRELINRPTQRSGNEAETRHKIVDTLIHNVLAWPRNRVNVEEYIAPGFADYVLTKSNGDHLLFIEAKKEGVYFELPLPYKSDEKAGYVALSKLISDPAIKAALVQVRTYCIDSGCEFAVITNGHEWVFFKTFEKGKKWEAQSAFVIRSLSFFDQEYTKAYNSLSFSAITEHASLSSMLSSVSLKDRPIFYPKEKITSYAHKIRGNGLTNTLRRAINYYFGVIGDSDTEFMERCYVSQRDYQDTTDGIRALMHDSISPYFEQYGVQQLEDSGKGGRLGGKLTKSLKNKVQGEVLVLFGGKGAGKSTFIKRLLHHNPPRWLLENSQIAIVDLLNEPEDKKEITRVIWAKTVAQMDTNGLLQADRADVISTLFADRYKVALRQNLAGLPHSSELFNSKLNELVEDWKSDKVYCAQRLVQYWAEQGRGTIIAVDNTDQYNSDTQDFCFTTAQSIASSLGCVVLISMREERFFDSKIHGVLDAYQNSGFHISSPKPAEVFRRRLDFLVYLLRTPSATAPALAGLDAASSEKAISYLSILSREFSNDSSPLNTFLSACAHGDIRLSLDVFRSFVLSGYTNVDEMVDSGSWKFMIHQVIKPVMIPDRYFYDETLSNIPNIYQARSIRNGSHFTGLRILRKLSKGLEKSAPPYFDVPQLLTSFVETFNMAEDFERNVDILLKHGFIEANNRLDQYSSGVDSIKITGYGLYMVRELAYYFTYLDLICVDCGLFSEGTSNYLAQAARQEYSLFLNQNRIARIMVRLERAEEFLKYLEEEEMRERDAFSLAMPVEEMFTWQIRQGYEFEKVRVLKSAKRQKPTRR